MDKAGESAGHQQQTENSINNVQVIDAKLENQQQPVSLEGSTNEQFVRCSFCNSLMLRPQTANMVTIEVRVLTIYPFKR